MNNAKNKMVIITGATSGIGVEYVRKYAYLGHNLLITRIKEQILQTFTLGFKCFALVLRMPTFMLGTTIRPSSMIIFR
jgi:NADP-dependent 3-hydroxy acid dehydrogenase YdfG